MGNVSNLLSAKLPLCFKGQTCFLWLWWRPSVPDSSFGWTRKSWWNWNWGKCIWLWLQKQTKNELTLENLLCTDHCSKCFTQINSFILHNSLLGLVFLLCPFSRRGKEGRGRLAVSASLQHVSHRAGISAQAVCLRSPHPITTILSSLWILRLTSMVEKLASWSVD